jgi:hypothetical protein
VNEFIFPFYFDFSFLIFQIKFYFEILKFCVQFYINEYENIYTQLMTYEIKQVCQNREFQLIVTLIYTTNIVSAQNRFLVYYESVV